MTKATKHTPGWRKAWCELTGGHDNEVLGAFIAPNMCWAFHLHCKKCGKKTKWYRVPVLDQEGET